MIDRKLKLCKTCGIPSYIWSHGNCKKCDTFLKFSSDPETLGKVIGHTERFKKEISKVDKKSTRMEEKSVQELLKLATIVFNKWIRNRDSKDGYFTCISCGEQRQLSQLQAGHYMPSTYSSLRFNEFNVNGEDDVCNCFDKDHLIGYRKNLVLKVGLDKVLELEATPLAADFKWDRLALMEIINKYKL